MRTPRGNIIHWLSVVYGRIKGKRGAGGGGRLIYARPSLALGSPAGCPGALAEKHAFYFPSPAAPLSTTLGQKITDARATKKSLTTRGAWPTNAD
jgi:hypothetical protein